MLVAIDLLVMKSGRVHFREIVTFMGLGIDKEKQGKRAFEGVP